MDSTRANTPGTIVPSCKCPTLRDQRAWRRTPRGRDREAGPTCSWRTRIQSRYSRRAEERHRLSLSRMEQQGSRFREPWVALAAHARWSTSGW